MHWWETASPTDVAEAINSGEDVNGRVQGFSPLHLAVWKSTPENVYLLLKLGANIDATSKEEGFTPVHFAILGGNIETLKLLIVMGAKVSIEDIHDHTPLQYAVLYLPDSKFVDALIGAGANMSEIKEP